MGRGASVRGQDILRQRGALPGGRRTAGQMGAEGRAGPPFPRGQALVDSTSPRYGEKAGYYSAVCLETGEVEWMDLEGNSNAGTSAAFLKQLRERHRGRLHVIRDKAPAHRGEAMREYMRTPGLGLRLVNPRFHEGRLCQATAQSSMAMRQSGAGRRKRQRETCAWKPGRRCRRGPGTSSTGCPAGNTRSSAAAAPSCNQWPKGFCENPSLVPDVPQMHIPLWLWFRVKVPMPRAPLRPVSLSRG